MNFIHNLALFQQSIAFLEMIGQVVQINREIYILNEAAFGLFDVETHFIINNTPPRFSE